MDSFLNGMHELNLRNQDYPYGIGFWDVDANIAGLTEADFLSDQTKQNIFNLNARTVWKRIPERR